MYAISGGCDTLLTQSDERYMNRRITVSSAVVRILFDHANPSRRYRGEEVMSYGSKIVAVAIDLAVTGVSIGTAAGQIFVPAPRINVPARRQRAAVRCITRIGCPFLPRRRRDIARKPSFDFHATGSHSTGFRFRFHLI
jgi:hypothetical protein